MNAFLVEIYHKDILSHKSYNEIKDHMESLNPSMPDLEELMNHLFRSPIQLHQEELAKCFIITYNLIRAKSQYPTYPDPNEGMARKKIKDIDEFVTNYQNSIFGFVKYVPEALNESK
jgi:hypothetical protein